jgi:hypothetical protein
MLAIFRKELGCLRPTDGAGEELLRKIKLGAVVTVEVKRPRNLQHHRKFWALMQLLYENQEHYQSADEICTVFKFRIGHTKKIKTRDGIVEEPLSIAFAAMDQDAFDGFYDRALDFAVKEILPGMQEGVLRAEVEELCR